MDQCTEYDAYENIYQVVDLNKLQTDFQVEDEISIFDMTSLGTLMLIEQASCDYPKSTELVDDDACLRRLSLAYEKLHTIPKILLQEIRDHVMILDISNNEFQNLDFISELNELTSLICDHNDITSETTIPYAPKLELLWMNHCKITELYPWAKKLQLSCPNLKYLSLMGNPVAPSYLNGGSFQEYLQYRFFVISLFPKLVHLDDKIVTIEQRKEAERRYHRHLVDRLVTTSRQNLPDFFRAYSEKVSEMFTPEPQFVIKSKRNVII